MGLDLLDLQNGLHDFVVSCGGVLGGLERRAHAKSTWGRICGIRSLDASAHARLLTRSSFVIVKVQPTEGGRAAFSHVQSECREEKAQRRGWLDRTSTACFSRHFSCLSAKQPEGGLRKRRAQVKKILGGQCIELVRILGIRHVTGYRFIGSVEKFPPTSGARPKPSKAEATNLQQLRSQVLEYLDALTKETSCPLFILRT
jgi:hypothetical protein